jgi:quinol monooxygenase YgiN
MSRPTRSASSTPTTRPTDVAVASIVRFTFRPEVRDEIPDLVDDMLRATRTFEGLERLDILLDDSDPDTWTLYEIWTDRESEDVYRAFRATPEGAIPRLGEVLAAPPILENFVIRD